jgi:hypothetical protein
VVLTVQMIKIHNAKRKALSDVSEKKRKCLISGLEKSKEIEEDISQMQSMRLRNIGQRPEQASSLYQTANPCSERKDALIGSTAAN